MIFGIIKIFGLVAAVMPTPYTMEECIASLNVLTLPTVLQAEAYCIESETMPELDAFTDEQVALIDEWANRQEAQ